MSTPQHRCRDCSKKSIGHWCTQWNREVEEWSLDHKHSWKCFQPCAGSPAPIEATVKKTEDPK